MFGPDQLESMEDLKKALLECPVLRLLNYDSPAPVILAVDSSNIGIGIYLCQCNEGNPRIRYYNRFGSITLNDRESHFLQPKLEIYGLYWAFHKLWLYLIGVRNLVVEVDARYIKGMLQNPNIAPLASINCWILVILMFHFKLPNDEPPDYKAEEEEFDDWIDHLYSFMHLINDSPIAVQQQQHKHVVAFKTMVHLVFVNDFVKPAEFSSYNGVPHSVKVQLEDDKMAKVIKFHNDLEWPVDMDNATYNKFIRTEFWTEQQFTQPPNHSYWHKPTETYYLGGYQVIFEEGNNHWIHKTTPHQFIKDDTFNTTFYLPGGPQELPEDLRLRYSLLATLKQSVIRPKGVFGFREQSELESEPSDEEPVQQLQIPVTKEKGTTLKEEDPFKPRSEPLVVDPPTPPPVEPEEEENAPPEPPNPDPRPNPITEPMADDKAPSNLGHIPEFKGKHSKAKAFIIDLELYQKMNPKRIVKDKVLISLTLQNISNDAMQWKENELADLDDNLIMTKLWNNWGGFKKQFLENWEEINSSGNAYTELQKLQKRKKAGVEGSSATYQFGQGLTSKEYKKITLTNPTKLENWYEAAHRLFNIKNQKGVVTSTQSEWDMDVDIIAVNAMSRDERERQVGNGLCFICHKDGHMSGECPIKKKGGSKRKDKGRHRGKGKKKK
ncbi:hypothetical protein AX14_000973 [Amanita brunnescens Koide BX004]|nr:hypothetical protein AX14_000973 [Amanita brunnescens Koide BX004]